MERINETMLRAMAWYDGRDKDEKGQGLTEYGLILALVAIAAVAALTGLGGKIKEVLTSVTGKMTTS